MKPAQVPAAREVVMRRADDVHVMIEPRAIGIELAAQVYGQVCAETIRVCDITAGRRTLKRNPELRKKIAVALNVPQHWIEHPEAVAS